MQGKPLNPYFNLASIRSSNMFFGRTNLLRRFYETVAQRQSVSLLGLRGIGKSSFLWYASLPEVQARFPFDLSHHIFVFLDLREYLQKNSEDFFHRASKEIVAQSVKVGLTVRSERKGEDEFSSVLDQVAEQDFFPVLLLDAFDRITLNKNFDLEFFEFLRAHASIGLISYVTASIAPLYEVCHRSIAGSPFFNIFYTYHLEALSVEDARELITIPALRTDMLFTETEADLVLKLAGRHPFFIQRVCYLLFEEKLLQGGGEIDEAYFKNLAYKDLLPHFKDNWERLSNTQQKLLQDEVLRKGNLHRELPELSESALFRQFVRNFCLEELFHMTPSELEDALDKIDDPKALSETNLMLMRAVSGKLSKNGTPSAFERGVAIRELLNETFELLLRPGSRRDSAVEWRTYNILYYRYFKHRLRNESIAERLNFASTRQYYRERKKAIETLLSTLFEIENTFISNND